MQALRDTIHVTPGEWRWVILFSGLLLLLAFMPFLWVAFSGAAADHWQFMGMLNNYRDGATYLAKMLQGVEGMWMIEFRHTTESHAPILIQVIYPALGHLARVIGLSPIAIFHVARVTFSLIMYVALYYLAATIWPHRLRPRRIFFTVVAIGAGFGWLFAPLTGNTTFPDLTIPEMFPFYSSLVNVHFPLAFACIALIVGVLITAFRPGFNEDPNVSNGGLIAGALSFFLALLYPQALLPMGAALVVYVLAIYVQERRIAIREMRWMLVVGLPALPLAVYYAAVVTYNPVAASWNQQNITPAPPPLVLVLGLGLPLLMALPGIWRALRHFEQDGDRFVLLWLIMIVLAIYFPSNVQRRFSVGLMIPIAYFATRALESFWFERISRRWRYRLLVAAVPLMVFSSVLILISNLNVTPGPFLKRDYALAMQWLKGSAGTDGAVLASEEVSIWVPGWTGLRVVYGHPFETVAAQAKDAQVRDWFAGENADDCRALLSKYNVRWVIIGPQETALGSTPCTDELTPVLTLGTVTVYAP
ncbi:MAG: hypothetical protein JNJ61_27845 [Anaerolineae bacterium]|nr:hypothetical protein [Anaerolineae bacterium]